MSSAPADYGARIRAAHAYSGLTISEVADRLDVSSRTIGRWIANESLPDLETAQRFADVCGVPVSFLVRGFDVARPVSDRLDDIERNLEHLLRTDRELARLLLPDVDGAVGLSDGIVRAVQRAMSQSATEAAPRALRPSQPRRTKDAPRAR